MLEDRERARVLLARVEDAGLADERDEVRGPAREHAVERGGGVVEPERRELRDPARHEREHAARRARLRRGVEQLRGCGGVHVLGLLAAQVVRLWTCVSTSVWRGVCER
jgi:hypothetical protein